MPAINNNKLFVELFIVPEACILTYVISTNLVNHLVR